MNVETLRSMDLDELEALISKGKAELKAKQSAKRGEVLAEMNRLAASIGVRVEIADKAETAGTPRRGRKVPVKYQNPQNLSERWTGRGMKPGWLQRELGAGRSIDEFKVAA